MAGGKYLLRILHSELILDRADSNEMAEASKVGCVCGNQFLNTVFEHRCDNVGVVDLFPSNRDGGHQIVQSSGDCSSVVGDMEVGFEVLQAFNECPGVGYHRKD